MDIRLKELLSKMDADDAMAIKLLLDNLGDSKLDGVTQEELEQRLEETRKKIKQIEDKALKRLKERELNPLCNYCSCKSSEVKHMLKSNRNFYICSNCIEVCYAQLRELTERP